MELGTGSPRWDTDGMDVQSGIYIFHIPRLLWCHTDWNGRERQSLWALLAILSMVALGHFKISLLFCIKISVKHCPMPMGTEWTENALLSWQMTLALSLHFRFSVKDQLVSGEVPGAPPVLFLLLKSWILRVNVGDALSSWLLQVGTLWTLRAHL